MSEWPGKVDCYCTHQSGVNEVICICGAKQWNEALSQCSAVRDGVTVEEIAKIIEKNKWIIGAKAMSGEAHINSSTELATAIVAFLREKLS